MPMETSALLGSLAGISELAKDAFAGELSPKIPAAASPRKNTPKETVDKR